LQRRWIASSLRLLAMTVEGTTPSRDISIFARKTVTWQSTFAAAQRKEQSS